MTLEEAFAATRPDLAGCRRVFGHVGAEWSEATRNDAGETTFCMTSMSAAVLHAGDVSTREPAGVTEWLTHEQYLARRRMK